MGNRNQAIGRQPNRHSRKSIATPSPRPDPDTPTPPTTPEPTNAPVKNACLEECKEGWHSLNDGGQCYTDSTKTTTTTDNKAACIPPKVWVIYAVGVRAKEWDRDTACPGRNEKFECLDEHGDVVTPVSKNMLRPEAIPGSQTKIAPWGRSSVDNSILNASGSRARNTEGIPWKWCPSPGGYELESCPSPSPSPKSTISPPDGPNAAMIILPIIGVLLLFVVGWYIYRQRKASKAAADGYGSSHFTHLLNQESTAEDNKL